MAQTIDVRSTVANADGFSVSVNDSTLICNRYFPTTAGDEFAGKEVLFDFASAYAFGFLRCYWMRIEQV